MAKIVNDTELIFEESDIGEDGNLNIKVFENNNLRDRVTKVVLPDGLKKIPEDTFRGCESLQKIGIPDSVTGIGILAFGRCKSLKKINIPDGVTRISDGTFSHCESLTEINIPDSVTKIGESAFENCESLKEINIPDSVTGICYEAFCNCKSLQEVNIPDSVIEISEGAFRGCGSVRYKGYNITDFINGYDSGHFDIIKSLSDNDLPLTNDMFKQAVEAKKENRLRGFLVKTKKRNEKRLSEREIPDIDYSNSDDFNKEF